MDMGFPFGVKKMFWNEIMVMGIPLWEYTKNPALYTKNPEFCGM